MQLHNSCHRSWVFDSLRPHADKVIFDGAHFKEILFFSHEKWPKFQVFNVLSKYKFIYYVIFFLTNKFWEIEEIIFLSPWHLQFKFFFFLEIRFSLLLKVKSSLTIYIYSSSLSYFLMISLDFRLLRCPLFFFFYKY